MKLIKNPVKGMKDILPEEMRIREYCLNIINKTYASYGFTAIETPIVESIENLQSKQGGDNEKLIFKILKRGEKFSLENAKCEDDIIDCGLRYDLTLPLSRYYSANADKLPSPFKALQIGSVFRADRPQRGRFRQFTQCDIDILGDSTCYAEIDLISATCQCLQELGFNYFNVKVNDRRILKALADYATFGNEEFSLFCVILDKLDKIGLDGVSNELKENGFNEQGVNKIVELLNEVADKENKFEYVKTQLNGFVDESVFDNVKKIIDVSSNTVDKANIVYDISLVRGMGYYTGTIFEIETPAFGGAIGGGGRYDEMIGKFTGQPTPACGFSIGFERIITLLLEQSYNVNDSSKKVAYLIEKGVGGEKLKEIFSTAKQRRANGETILITVRNKNVGFQKSLLEKDGYTEFVDVYKN